MRILLCAYACEPEKGSEPGIGWSWGRELAKLGHKVTILTRTANRRSIESFLDGKAGRGGDWAKNVTFAYFELPSWTQFAVVERVFPYEFGKHFLWHLWHYPYHFLWQKGALKLAKRLHSENSFDVVHLVTFATLRRAVFYGELGCLFILGPAGGGERAPSHLRFAFGFRNGLYESAREWSIWITRMNPAIRRMCNQAAVIYATTAESQALVPASAQSKVHVKLQLGLESLASIAEQKPRGPGEPLKILYVGRFLYWKGMSLGIRAFARLALESPLVSLTMVGAGPEEQRWRDLARELGVSERISWVPWMRRDELHDLYAKHHVFLFPSLHDSGGLVVIEAMSAGIPVVCLNLGGPGVSVTPECGSKIDTTHRATDDLVDSLAHALRGYRDNEATRRLHAAGALHRAEDFRWENVVASIYRDLE